MENRAAVFTSKPQAVEVYQAGAWWSGELLGWRHAADGSCQVWVRVVLDGIEETAWTGLETLRLPERHLAMAPEPSSARSVDRELSVARHPSSRREHRADGDTAPAPATVGAGAGAAATAMAMAPASLPVVRDLSVVAGPAAASAGGRRRAPDVPVAPQGGGRRRAPEEPVPASSGGRRRAPETAAVVAGGRRRAPEEPLAASSGGRRRAPEDAAAPAGPAALLGRHGVPSTGGASGHAGRHRTADTGLLPAVSDATASLGDIRRPAASTPPSRGPVVATARSARALGDGSGPTGGWSAPNGLDPELLTRPLRLSDQLPHSGRPRLDRSRPGG